MVLVQIPEEHQLKYFFLSWHEILNSYALRSVFKVIPEPERLDTDIS